MLSDLTVLP